MSAAYKPSRFSNDTERKKLARAQLLAQKVYELIPTDDLTAQEISDLEYFARTWLPRQIEIRESRYLRDSAKREKMHEEQPEVFRQRGRKKKVVNPLAEE